MKTSNVTTPKKLGIGLGANIPSNKGTPCSTLIAVRPLIERIIIKWASLSFKKANTINENNLNLIFKWSPLFETKPIGGPENQPLFINAVLIVEGGKLFKLQPSKEKAKTLLVDFQKLERDFGRERNQELIKWGPRPIDIDLLYWGDLQVKDKDLTLPHPHLLERDFVVVPLAYLMTCNSNNIRKLSPFEGWSE